MIYQAMGVLFLDIELVGNVGQEFGQGFQLVGDKCCVSTMLKAEGSSRSHFSLGPPCLL